MIAMTMALITDVADRRKMQHAASSQPPMNAPMMPTTMLPIRPKP